VKNTFQKPKLIDLGNRNIYKPLVYLDLNHENICMARVK